MYNDLVVRAENIVKRKGAPKSLLDLPEKFKGESGTVKKGIETALILGLKYDLFPEKIPYEKLWYKFIKLVAQKLKKSVAYPKTAFENALKHLVEDTGFWYKDFGIKTDTTGEDFKHLYHPAETKSLFPRSIIHLEKESDVEDLLNFRNLVGIDLYTTKGQSSRSKAEKLALLLDKKEDRDEVLNIFSVSDYDPAGLSITESYKKQLEIFLNRLKQKIGKTIRVAPFPDNYTPKELEKAAYYIAPITAKHKLWTNPEREKERIESDFIDPRFKDINFYKTGKESEIRRMLKSAKIKKNKEINLIKKWRDELEKTGKFPHMLGLEVASLPDEPLPHQLPEGIKSKNIVGAARLRLLLLDKLLEESGIKDDFYRNIITRNFHVPLISWEIEKDTELYKLTEKNIELKDIISNIYKKMYDKHDNKSWEEGEELQEKINTWRKNELKEVLEDPERKEGFIEALRRSAALDYNQKKFLSRNKNFGKPYPTIPEEYKTQKASQELKDDIEKDVNYLDSLLKSLKLKTEIKRKELGIIEKGY